MTMNRSQFPDLYGPNQLKSRKKRKKKPNNDLPTPNKKKKGC